MLCALLMVSSDSVLFTIRTVSPVVSDDYPPSPLYSGGNSSQESSERLFEIHHSLRGLREVKVDQRVKAQLTVHRPSSRKEAMFVKLALPTHFATVLESE